MDENQEPKPPIDLDHEINIHREYIIRFQGVGPYIERCVVWTNYLQAFEYLKEKYFDGKEQK